MQPFERVYDGRLVQRSRAVAAKRNEMEQEKWKPANEEQRDDNDHHFRCFLLPEETRCVAARNVVGNRANLFPHEAQQQSIHGDDNEKRDEEAAVSENELERRARQVDIGNAKRG